MWANSGDSHLMEPPDLFASLPEDIRDRLPRSVKDPSGDFETIYIDGQEFRRDLPKRDSRRRGWASTPVRSDSKEEDFITRVIGGNDPAGRIKDLDDEGVWGEVIYPSLGIWTFNVRTPRVVKEGCRALNDWALAFQQHSPRFVCVASVPLVDIDDAVAEVKRAHGGGFMAGSCRSARRPAGRSGTTRSGTRCGRPLPRRAWSSGSTSAPSPTTPTQRTGVYYRGRGGAVLNYVETTYGGQRAVTQLIACGALDRHPELRVLVSEGGATWGPFIADRMDEGTASTEPPSGPTSRSCRAGSSTSRCTRSFQHDVSAVAANSAMGWQNVMWGSDYPHFEGTFGHTQKTLHELFDGVDPEVSRRVRIGAFQELFPSVPAPPDE